MTKMQKNVVIVLIVLLSIFSGYNLYDDWFKTYDTYEEIQVPDISKSGLTIFDDIKFGPVKERKNYGESRMCCDIEIYNIEPKYIDDNIVSIEFQCDDHESFHFLLDKEFGEPSPLYTKAWSKMSDTWIVLFKFGSHGIYYEFYNSKYYNNVRDTKEFLDKMNFSKKYENCKL